MINSGKSVNVALYLAMSMTILLHEIIKYVINNNIEAEIMMNKSAEICHS